MVGLPGTDLDRETRRRIRSLSPGGVILFARNLDDAEQTATLLDAVRGELPYPLLLAIDQEGGRVSRLEPWIGATPTAARLARAGIEETRRFGRATGAALASLGFNVDFAPVVDLCSVEATNGIADRSFGLNPSEVTELAGAFLEGLQASGVAGCLKHFPGLGETHVDSHVELPTARRTAEQIRRHDLEPFRRLRESAASVMVGHGHYPDLDPKPGRPASLSPTIVDGLLRREIGFRGLIVTDDLEMGAVAPIDRDGSAAVGAIEAGCDLALYCADLDRAAVARDALESRAAVDSRFSARLDQAATAVARCAEGWSGGRGAEWDQALAVLRRYSTSV